MDKEETLREFLQILGRIKDLVGEVTPSDDGGLDIATAIEQLRQSGKNDDADEVTELVQRAEALQALHQ